MAKHKDLVAEFESDYEHILADAERAAEATATDAWQGMYHRFKEETKIEAANIAKGLYDVSQQTLAGLISSDALKFLGGSKSGLRIFAIAWPGSSRTRSNRSGCPSIRRRSASRPTRAARRRRPDAGGMYARDIEDRIADAIARQRKIIWNEKVGTIQIAAATKPV